MSSRRRRRVAVAETAGYLISHQLVDSFARSTVCSPQVRTRTGCRARSRREWQVVPGRHVVCVGETRTRAQLEKIAAELGVGADATTERCSADGAEAAPAARRSCGISTAARWIPDGRDGFSSSISSRSRRCFRRRLTPAISTRPTTCWCSSRAAFQQPGAGAGAAQPRREDIPAQYRPMLGRMTAERSIPEHPPVHRERRHRHHHRRFVHQPRRGISSFPSTITSWRTASRSPRRSSTRRVLILTARVDVTHPVAHGLKERTDMFFDTSPVFRLGANAAESGGEGPRVVRSPHPRSRAAGRGANSTCRTASPRSTCRLGKGRVLLFGPEIIKRAQPHATFKFLFNGLFYAAAVEPNSSSR